MTTAAPGRPTRAASANARAGSAADPSVAKNGYRVERVVGVRQRPGRRDLHVGVGEPIVGEVDEAGVGVDPADRSPPAGRQAQGEAGPAAHVEKSGVGADPGLEERGLVQVDHPPAQGGDIEVSCRPGDGLRRSHALPLVSAPRTIRAGVGGVC